MILHFPTHEMAAFAVARLREDGHYADVMDAAVPGLWGPAVTDGVRVLASEEFLEEGEDEIPGPPGQSGICAALDPFFRVVLQSFWVLAMGVIGLVFLFVFMDKFLALVVFALEMTLAIYLAAALSISWHQWLSNSILRGHGGPLGSKRIVAIVWVLIFFRAIMG